MIKIVLLSVTVFSLVVYGAFLAFTLSFRPRKGARIALGSRFPRVSVLKPMKNLVDDIAANLESYFTLDYPNYELIFGLDSLDDASLPVIRSLGRRFPEIPVTIIATGHSDEENPKIFKLAKMEAAATGELFWVTDANTRVSSDTLNRLILEYGRSGAHVVFSPIRGTGSRSLPSLMENMGLNLFTSGNIIAAWKAFGQQIIVGKSMLIEKAALDHFGGFSYFSSFLAEDFVIGQAFENAGFTLSCDCTWIDNVNRSTTFAGFFNRMTRWAKLRLRLKPIFYILEIFLNPVALSLVLPLLFPTAGWLMLAGVWSCKIFIEFASFLVMSHGDQEPWGNLLRVPPAVVLKDLILLAVYVVPFFSRTLVWQGGNVSIGRRTRIGGQRELLALEGA
ncbi:MAG TPA: glycosyltransferase [Candidatus Binatia bacterium]|nr:glycosyltransferase [Candidatus Binatia bacterium]